MTVLDVNKVALVLSWDLGKVRLWAWQWRMKFKADKNEEVAFSCKRKINTSYPYFRDETIFTISEHKHHGVILDSKLNFKTLKGWYFKSTKMH